MSVYDALARARGRGQRVVLVTVLEVSPGAASHTGAKLVADADGAIAGSLGCSEFDTAGVALAAEALAEGGPIPRRVTFEGHGAGAGVDQRAIEVFAEVHEPQPMLLVVGATPVGLAVAVQARLVGRRVTLVAPGGTTDVPAGVEVKADDPGRYLLAAPPGPEDAVLLSDHDAPYVEEVLRVALASGARFVGMLGSRRHAPAAVRRLRDAGTPEAHLARLRAPVGLDVGGRSPEEIALSIVAEVLAAEHGRDGGRLGLDWSAREGADRGAAGPAVCEGAGRGPRAPGAARGGARSGPNSALDEVGPDRDPLVPDERVDALLIATPPGWEAVALADLRATMSDHAHAEKKAALSALSLLNSEPGRDDLVVRMAKLAREEIRHLDQVVGHLRGRGWTLAKDRPDRFAKRLLAERRGGGGAEALCDRLLVNALIEARSWERLNLLGRALADAGEGALADFYVDLARSEAGHYRVFVDLATAECPGEDVAGRLAELAEVEAAVISALPHEARIH